MCGLHTSLGCQTGDEGNSRVSPGITVLDIFFTDDLSQLFRRKVNSQILRSPSASLLKTTFLTFLLCAQVCKHVIYLAKKSVLSFQAGRNQRQKSQPSGANFRALSHKLCRKSVKWDIWRGQIPTILLQNLIFLCSLAHAT